MKVRILINGKENNNKRINDALNAVQKRTRVREIDTYQIYTAINQLVIYLGINKKDMIGIKADIDCNAQRFAKSYKGNPESTQFTVERTRSGWVITDIRRERCKSPNKRFNVTLTDRAKQALIESRETF